MERRLRVPQGWSARAEPLRHWLRFAADPGVCRAPPLHCPWQAAVRDVCQSYSFEQVMRQVETRGKKTLFHLLKISAGGNERISCCRAS